MTRSATVLAPAETIRDATYRKVAWRLMPLVLLCYVANTIDRTNPPASPARLWR